MGLITKCSQFSTYIPAAYNVTQCIAAKTTPEDLDALISRNYPTYNFAGEGTLHWNALGTAASVNNIPVIRYIIEKGGRQLLSVGNKFGMTPLFHACAAIDLTKSLETALVLVNEFNAGVNIGTSQYERETPKWATPLWSAAKVKNLPLVRFLLLKDAYAISSDKEVNSVVHQVMTEISNERRGEIFGVTQLLGELSDLVTQYIHTPLVDTS
ncbi:MAG: ankyrin repeat domain-containing protein, partial [Chlamydiota bacterium]